MVIYVDIFSFGNFIVNLFLLFVLVKSLGIKMNYKKCLLSSSIGTVYALLVLYSNLNIILSNLLIKLIVELLMVAVVVGHKNLMLLLKSSLLFLSFTFLLAGFMIFIEINGKSTIYLFIYRIRATDIITGIMILILILDRLYYFLKERISTTDYIFEIEINMFNKCIKINSFLDTGNELKEPITNLPVVLLEKDLIDDALIDADKCYLIPYNTADGTKGTMKAFKPERFAINKDGNFMEKEVIIAIADVKFSKENEYKALLNKALLI